ncbi:MAG: reverse transcriptase domain-containing protein [Aeromonas sp.]
MLNKGINSVRTVRTGTILFVLAMERPISGARPEIGNELESHHLHSILYADDMVLLANSESSELQTKMDGLITTLASCGMSLNTKKSAARTIEKDVKTKAMLLAPERYRTGNGQIKPLGIGDTQKYLELDYDWKGRVTPRRTTDLERMLGQIKAAPLKPQQ